jgi:fatty-acyl-CoA synthase
VTRSERVRASEVPERIARVAATSGGHGVTFVGSAATGGPEGEPVRVSWGELFEDAARGAGALVSRGLGRSSHVALLGPTTRALVTAIEACWLLGATVVVLPLPMRLGSLEEFVGQTRDRLQAADVDLVLVDPSLAAFVPPAPGDPPVVGLDELGREAARSHPAEPARVGAEELALLQFTSGSTADPKGVMVPYSHLATHVDAMVAAAGFDPAGDRMASWLPLYHDMGLVGFLGVPMLTGTDLVLGAPQDFLGAPRRWLEWMTTWQASATAGPNFAYALATRALRREAEGLDLSSLRIALNGAEPVDPAAVEAFTEAGRPAGLDPGAVFCAFGMAEATLAVSFPRTGEGLRTDTVDRRALEHESLALPVETAGDGADPARVRRLARLGRAVPGLELRVVEPSSGRPRAEREVGEIEIRGSTVTPGYYRNPEATRAAFRDGWLRTGDLGYLADGELVACGRIKDVIVVGGRKVFPEDVERAASRVEGVRAGNVIAFGVEGRRGRERVVVVAEVREAVAERLRTAVVAAVRGAVGLVPEDVVLVSPGTLPKTSSGKLQRSLCRARYLAEELVPV